MRRVYIYKFFFLDEPNIVYIGKAVDVDKRFKAHLSPSQLRPSTSKTNWIKNRLALGKIPSYVILDSSTNPAIVDLLEISLIDHYRNNPQFTVKNSTGGGEGMLGYSFSEESKTKMSNSAKGRVMDAATKEKIRKANTGILRSVEFKERCSIAQSQRSAETRDKLSQANAKHTYILISPEGQEHEVRNLTKFCSENGIPRANMSSVISGNRSHSAGWTGRRIY